MVVIETMESNRDNIIFSLIPESVSFIRDSIIRFRFSILFSLVGKDFIVAVLEFGVVEDAMRCDLENFNKRMCTLRGDDDSCFFEILQHCDRDRKNTIHTAAISMRT
jgi:hypothetical protein